MELHAVRLCDSYYTLVSIILWTKMIHNYKMCQNINMQANRLVQLIRWLYDVVHEMGFSEPLF